MAMTDGAWGNVFKNIREGTIGQMPTPPTTGKFSKLKSVAKRFGPEMLGWILLEKYLAGRHQSKMQDIQMDAARQQADTATPESLYQQAALPQAQAGEDMARTALLTHLSGGVIGPTLARGERMIGG